MEFHIYTLPNGIRCIHRQIKGNVTHCALMVNAGSRDELRTEYGLAHFTEHGFFKGTEHRKAYQVNCRLENLGGELNAYTTKEDTTIHATTLRGDFTKAVELLSDVAFHSTFPDKELSKEREVIVDEINTYKDSPVDNIYDTFEDMLFDGSELGHNILGTRQDIAHHNSSALHNFVGRTYTTDQMVFSSIGNISCSRIEEIATHYFASQPCSTRTYKRLEATSYNPFYKCLNKHTHQTHCVVGNRAYGIMHPKRLPLALLVNILGGPCANSILNVTLREKHGLSYNIEASYTPYSDTGIVAIYFSSDRENADQCNDLIAQEIKRLQSSQLSQRHLSMAKKQFIAQMSISMEGNEGYMLGVGKSLLVHSDVDTLDEVYRKINAVTAEQICDVANEIFTNNSTLIYK